MQRDALKKIQSAQELGETIRRRRKELGLTQLELVQYCGCSPKFLIELEAGKPTVRFDKVLKIIMMLGCDLCVQSRDGTAL